MAPDSLPTAPEPGPEPSDAPATPGHAEAGAGVVYGRDQLLQTHRALLDRFRTPDTPLDPDLVRMFEQAQSRLAKDLDTLAREIGTTHPRVQELSDRYLEAMYAARRYNKEAAYFAKRKKVFPGMFTSKWFHLDHLHFPLIDITCFDPWGLK